MLRIPIPMNRLRRLSGAASFLSAAGTLFALVSDDCENSDVTPLEVNRALLVVLVGPICPVLLDWHRVIASVSDLFGVLKFASGVRALSVGFEV